MPEDDLDQPATGRDLLELQATTRDLPEMQAATRRDLLAVRDELRTHFDVVAEQFTGRIEQRDKP